MAITEESRHRLHQRLEQVLGEDTATTLMEHLPPRGWGDVSTKRDLDHLQAATTRDVEDLRTELKRDIDGLRTELKGDIDALRVDLKRDVEGLRIVTELKFDHIEQTMATKQDLHDGLRSVVVTMVVTNLAFWGLALATLRAL